MWAGLTVALIYVDSKRISSRYARKGLISDLNHRMTVIVAAVPNSAGYG